MNTPTSQGFQDDGKRRMLEDKLKTHIKREFNLGEKVITLLKQKKQLETSLQKQLQAQESLKQELEVMMKSKKSLEQKFLRTQKKLQNQQNVLQNRSQRIIANEEGSRETLEYLREKIYVLKGLLKTVDKQKVAEQTRLLKEIQSLRQKETSLSQELPQISHQRDRVEKQLQDTTKKFQKLSHEHQEQTKHSEQQIKSLLATQLNLESTIELLFDEQKINEDRLRQEVQSLQISKAQLEKKIRHLEQKNAQTSWDLDADLLQVIEKQEHFIRDLKEKAHKRSTLLKTKNESLKKKIEKMSSSQEKVRWENQMLESSFKGLQADLAEYIQLKKKFESAQQEQEHFEEIFHRRIRFLEDRHAEDSNQEAETNKRLSNLKKRIEKQQTEKEQTTPAGNHVRSFSPSMKSRLLNWLSASSGMFLNTAVILIVAVSSIAIYRLMPWEYIQLEPPFSEKQLIVGRSEEIPEINILEGDEFFVNVGEENYGENGIISSSRTQEETPQASEKSQSGKSVEESLHSEILLLSKTTEVVNTLPTQKVKSRKAPKRPIDIVVQLSPEQANRFPLQNQEPFPTIENNSILRRHYEQKQ